MVNENINIARVTRGIVIEDFGSALKMNGIVTDVLYVHPDGNGSTGLTWETAYTTFLAAYTAASSDVNDFTLILVSAGTFDFDIAGGQLIAKNIAIRGAGTGLTIFKNSHASNTYIFSVSRPFYLSECTLYRVGTCNGLVLTSGAKATLDGVYFDFISEAAAAGVAIDVTNAHANSFRDTTIIGDGANTIGVNLNISAGNVLERVFLGSCAVGAKIENAVSDRNTFHFVLFFECVLGLDIDAGNAQIFDQLVFHGCTTNIDDEVGDSYWAHIDGNYPIESLPQDLVGVTVADGAAGAYGAYVEIISAATNDGPFRIVGMKVEAEDAGHHALRLSADNGTTFFYEVNIEATAAQGQTFGINLPAGSEYIFNKGTQITAAWKSSDGNSEANLLWLQRQYLR